MVDDFLPGPEALALRERALAGGFHTVEHGGVHYHGIGVDLESDLYFGLTGRLQAEVGFTVEHKLSFFRLNTRHDLPSTYIHADSAEAEYAAVLYLTLPEQCRGGTAFWRHRESGTVQPQMDANARRLNEDGLDEGKWELMFMAGMAFNRVIVYPGALFHSRYPQQTWGEGPEDGRLIWCCFFNEAGRGSGHEDTDQ